jgi:hypothetical protein
VGLQRFFEHIALVPCRMRATGTHFSEAPEPPRITTAAFEAVIGVIDVRLLLVQIRVLRHEAFPSSLP